MIHVGPWRIGPTFPPRESPPSPPTWKTVVVVRMRRWRPRLPWLMLCVAALFAPPAADAQEAPPAPVVAQAAVTEAASGDMADRNDAACLRCHGMQTMAYQDRETGRLVSLYVDQERMAQSSHGQMACLACHGDGFMRYPHDQLARMETRHCVDCHLDNGPFQRNRFEHIEREFQRSAHFQAMPDRFDCFSCHDPHTFQGAMREAGVATRVRRDNQTCMKCHGPEGITAVLGDRPFASLDLIHNWLPKTRLHWRTVRCVECHTPHLGGSHVILGAQYAERKCVACHSRDSILLTKLFQHQVLEERERSGGGFINGVALNEAYIIGMTRNAWLDRFAAVLMGLTVLGVSGHGLARYLAARRRKQ